MKDTEFNLACEPWILVVKEDGSVKEVSMTDAIINAHTYRSIGGEMAAQDIAVLRCLIALVHTVFSRVDTQGKVSDISTEEECIERWRCLWNLGQFPQQPTISYFEQWRERFWLFHPTRPFYQVPQAAQGTKNEARKLNGAVSESNNKIRLFSQVSGIGKEFMTYAESARWLLFLNGFDDCAGKQSDKTSGSRSSTVAWLGKLGLVYAIGDNLFETIMLNMPMLYGKDELPWETDAPTWELAEAHSRERVTIEMPKDLAGLYTLQSRRILFARDSDCVTGYNIMGGDAFEDINALNEPMTLWRVNTDKKTGIISYKPLLHKRQRYIWRNFAAFTVDKESSIAPGIINWIDRLRKEKVLPRNKLLTFGVVCVRYDSSQSSSITDSFSDNVMFHADILSDAGKEWREEIHKQLEKIDRAAYYLESLVKNLRRANGLNPKKDDMPAESIKQELFDELNLFFREWLAKIDPDNNIEEIDAIALELETYVRKCAIKIGKSQINQAGESAYIGRKAKDDKNAERHYSSPEIYRWFMYNIWKIYPDRKGDEKVEE